MEDEKLQDFIERSRKAFEIKERAAERWILENEIEQQKCLENDDTDGAQVFELKNDMLNEYLVMLYNEQV